MEHSMEQSTEKEQGPKLCKNMCGFWGSETCEGMCSKCYRERQAEEQKVAQAAAVVAAAPANAPAPAAPAPAAPPAAPAAAAAVAAEAAPSPEPKPVAEAAAEELPAAPEKPVAVLAEEPAPMEAEPPKPVQANRSRCFACNKKCGLLGFECRCGYVFCTSHRHAQDHSCSFDYKTMDRDKLAKANPTVAAARVNKI